MDVLNAKKGRKPLQYVPEALDPDAISDDDYDVLNGDLPDVIDEFKLNEQLDNMLEQFSISSHQKVSKDLTAKNKLKHLDWKKHFSVIGGEINLDKNDIEDDFKRESLFTAISTSNLLQCSNSLAQANIAIGRPEDIKFQLFNDFAKVKKFKPLKGKKQKKKRRKEPLVPIDDSRYQNDPYGEEEEEPRGPRRHVKEKEYRDMKKQQKGRKKRPGKWSRALHKSNV